MKGMNELAALLTIASAATAAYGQSLIDAENLLIDLPPGFQVDYQSSVAIDR